MVRHDSDLRVARLTEELADAHSIDAVIEVLVRQVRDFVAEDPGAQALLYEMFSASRSNEEIRAEMAALWRRQRGIVADALREKEREGAITLRGDAEAVVSVLFALGDGLELQLLADPEWDSEATFETGIATARFLLGA